MTHTPRPTPDPNKPSAASKRIPRGTAIGAGLAATVALGLTALTAGQHAQSASPKQPPTTAAPSAHSPKAGGPLANATAPSKSQRPDNTSKADQDAAHALKGWRDSNPKGNASQAVGSKTVLGAGGDVREVLRIPALGKNWAKPVYEGVSDRQLRAGIGHFPGTEQPGQIGNFSIAGHRSGVQAPAFRDIDNIRPGTSIMVTSANRVTYSYRVTRVSTVDPDDVNVIAQVPGKPTAAPTKPLLTLITCWPATGHSRRVVVIAELASAKGGT
ncbi:sortase [Streptomyces sp. MS1.AVA.3]|uniref:sortase n=1 Tax=Streptomyces decoyicus TaxID=249567 RepID=UPI0030BF16C8